MQGYIERGNLTIDTRGKGWVRVFEGGRLIVAVVYEQEEDPQRIATILTMIGDIITEVEKSENSG